MSQDSTDSTATDDPQAQGGPQKHDDPPVHDEHGIPYGKRWEEAKTFEYHIKEYNHTLVGWNITVMGLFVAGILAMAVPPEESLPFYFGWILAMSTLILFWCLVNLAHNSARVEKLKDFFREGYVPPDFYKQLESVRPWFYGTGSSLFVCIFGVMWAAVFVFAHLKFW